MNHTTQDALIAFRAYYPAGGIDGKQRRYQHSATYCPRCGYRRMAEDATGCDYIPVHGGSNLNGARCADCHKALNRADLARLTV